MLTDLTKWTSLDIVLTGNSCNVGTMQKHLFQNHSHRTLILMVFRFGRFIARNGRNRLNRHTHTHKLSTVTLLRMRQG